ncbi:MAG TPA: murein biosynthesis integral membrane protein MurJ [Xanthobacteraceae bacterium]|jgi:putative peptidoglycan lipid II flippase|nr:murein biosynthesis integral membrane protein MurJ [Xanthobacteraceae bacterium]
MIERILTVGGLTLLSRLTGFMRDIVLAAILGAGPGADAFFVALRLPNHFRAIFAEGAFNAAFVPAYARIRGQSGAQAAGIFADRIFMLLLASQVVLLAAALLFTPAVISLLAPGFADDPGRFALAVDLTRITFPYLLLITLVTLYGGILNALQRFAAAAAAPILLNLSMMATLALAVFFPTAGHAAAWGVFIAGCLQVVLVGGDAARQGVLPRFRELRFDEEVKRFFKALGPATLGSAGTQIALFADTIIASFLPAGALSALYYADRLNQLPIGVIGIAAGTVLLPEMASRIAAGDEEGARHSQNRAVELTLLLSLPCLVAFLIVPDLIMLALFGRGAFTADDAAAAGATLAAYTVGLLPFVLIRSFSAPFLARGDTLTPVKALLASVVVNVAFKVLLMGQFAQVGLALATSIGGWINFLLVAWFARRAGFVGLDKRLKRSLGKLAISAAVLAAVLWAATGPVTDLFAHWRVLRAEATLATLAVLGMVAYGGAIAVLFGREWLAAFRRRRATRLAVAQPIAD